MIKLISKITLIILLCSTAFLAKAQRGYDYAQYEVGFATGINTATSADVQTLKFTPSVHVNFTYNQGPFVNYVFEVQVGRLKGGDAFATSSGREFENHFSAYLFKLQLQAGEFIDYSQSPFKNVIKNFYGSAGLGYIANNIVTRTPDIRLPPDQILPGDLHSTELFIPARIGYEFKIFNNVNEPSIKIDLGYQYNFILGDNLDGYSTGKHNDIYSQFTVGVKFAIGGVTSYRKQIYY